LAIFLMSTDKGGLSAMRFHRLANVTYATALLMLRKIRAAMGGQSQSYLRKLIVVSQKILHTPGKRPTWVSLLVACDSDDAELVAVLSPSVGAAVAAEVNKHTTRERGSPACASTVAAAVTLLKRFFLGTYHRSSKSYLQLYLNEFLFRYKQSDSVQLLWELMQACISSSAPRVMLLEETVYKDSSV
jgi:hypothetical protein